MERVLAAGLLAMIISIVAGPKFIDFLRRNEMGQHIREEGPEGHRVKQGTPTMGGLLMVFSATVAFLLLSHYTTEGLAFRRDARLRRGRLWTTHEAPAPLLARPRRPLGSSFGGDHGRPALAVEE
jgi:UDP-N-acetylmuramyl pentapeptide phosphotransferase/UDP-N-acetylglucosamine-1-phosphate transferase